MAFRDTWHRTLVYFGLAEDEAYEDEFEDEPVAPVAHKPYRAPEPYRDPEPEPEDRYAERPNVRRLSPRQRRDEIDDIFADDAVSERRTGPLRPVGGARGYGRGANGRGAGETRSAAPRAGDVRRDRDVRVHFVAPKSFNDVQDVADKFKDSIPVILNLQGTGTDLAKRLIDFSSGLTYALEGGLQRIADKVFLLTPHNVEVSAEERARLVEKGFFNQS
ncbi:MAG: cell division protein SepF [Solirubrobacterales bacterium]|nr:MAG: cell division protein SepF [Solirubrobacterales bacterium]